MYQLSLLCLLPLVVSVSNQLGNNGIGYFGTSNVRYQKTYPPPSYLSGKSQSSSISTTTYNPPSTTKTAPSSADLPQINRVNVTTSSEPIYIPRRKPFILPRRPKLGFRPKQQPIHTSTVVEFQPNLFLDKQSVKLDALQPSLISISQPSKVSAPQLVIQVTSGPQTPINTTLKTSTVEMSVLNEIVSPTLTPVPPFETVSGPNASPAVVQPEKVSFDLTTGDISKKEPMSPLQAESILQTKPELNPASPQEQDLQLRTESFLRSPPSLSKSNHISYSIRRRPHLTLVPVLDSVSVEEPGATVSPFLNISDDNQGSTTETSQKEEPAAGTAELLSRAITNSSGNTITYSPIINTTTQTPIITENQPSLVIVPKLSLTETETQVITSPRVVIQLITDPQQPLNSVSAIYHPDETSIQFNTTADIELPTNTPTSVLTVLPKIEPALKVTNSEIKIKSGLLPQLELVRTAQPELEQTTQLEPEQITLSKTESTTQPTFQSEPNLNTPDTISLSVMIQSKDEELIKENTTVPPLRGENISESSFTFEIPTIATNQTLITTKSQLIEISPIQTPIVTSQPAIMTTSPMLEATTTLPESDVLSNNQPQTVIVQLLMPPQSSLSVAPQLPVNPVSKSLAVIESKLSVPETPQNTDQPELFSVTEVSDSKSELSTQQEFKLDSRPNSELASGFESETIFKPEVEISNKPYTYPIKLRPQSGIVTVPDSAWKHVSLKPQPVVLPPLLPRPIPVRDPAYGRLYFTQYPITSLTSNVPKVSPITKPTLAPFISKLPYNVWQTTHPESESNTQPELESTTQLEPEHITLPKSETMDQPTAQSKLNSHTSDTVSLSVMIQSKDEELIKEHTTVPPLRGDDISESSFTFEIPTNATNQTLITTKSQLIEISPIQTHIVTSQPAIMTTSPMLEATSTLPESDVLSNNQPQTVIVQLLMPPQSSLSVAPQLPVNPVSKSLAVIESKLSVPETPQNTDQPELFSVTEVSDSKSELSTQQEFKLDSRPNSELASGFESETIFKPEVEISNKPYTYPIKLRPQSGIVTVPDSAWKHVSLKPQPVVLPPLLPRPIPVRDPAYGRLYFTQYPITSLTSNVPKVSPITKPTLAPFISKLPYNVWQTTHPESESNTQPELESTTQLEPEHITLPKSETIDQPTAQSKLNSHTSDTVSLSVMIQSKDEELIKEHTTVPPLRGDDISESSFTFEIPTNATNQTLITTKSQLIEISPIQTPIVTSQPAIMTTSPMLEATTTLPESDVLSNNQPQTVIVQLLMPPQSSLSVAPQLPVNPVSKSLAVIESKSSVPETPQNTDQPDLFSVTEVSDSKSELSTQQEFKLGSRPNSELASGFESETIFKPEVEISNKPYTYPIKLRPQNGIVTVPDSAWKHVSLKPQPVVLPPLLPRPIPVRDPAYGRLYFTQYPITSLTSSVPKVSPITKPTLAPFMSAIPYNVWQTIHPELESNTQPELESTTQLEPEYITLPKSETTNQPTAQSKLNSHTPDTVSLSVMIQSKDEELIKEHTTVPPLRGDDISESSFTFEIPTNATNQTLITTKSQLIEISPIQTPIVTSQPAIMTTSPMLEATTPLPESDVLSNNQPQTVIVQLLMPPQSSLSVAPQLPVNPVSKSLAVIESKSSVPETPQSTDQPELFSVTEVSDSKSELSIQQEFKLDSRPNSELASSFESETIFKPEVEISNKPYTYPIKLRPQNGIVTVPDSAWKHVSLKPQPVVLPPLLPRPIPVRDPAYGRLYFTQYPITSMTRNVPKVSPITKPTLTPFISKIPYNVWQTTHPESESNTRPELESTTQLEPEHITLPKSETTNQPTAQSKLNSHTPDTVSLSVMIQSKDEELIKEHTTVPPLRGDDISESSFTFEIPTNATNQTLITTKSQLIEISPIQTSIVTSQPAIMTTSPMLEATTTLPESDVLSNNQPQTVIVQLLMPPKSSLSVAPQLPVNPVSKSLAVIESKSSVPETPQNTDQPELFSVTEVSDSKSELSTQQEFKLDSRPNSESASGFESETIFKPEVEISNKAYTYPIKLRPQNGIVTVPDSAWKHVSLKPQPVVLPPLLSRPIPVRDPAYGRLYFTQYPITSLTSSVPKVSPITKPTLAPFISKIPYNVWQTTHPESESNTQPELESTTQLEPEHITLPKSETIDQPTAQSKLNSHTLDTVSLSVMIRSKDEELIKEHTTIPPLRGDDISESSFTFEIPTNATNQTLITTKSQLIEISPIQTSIVTSQPAIMTTSPMLEATTPLPESDVLSNNQPQTVIVQLVMPPQSSLSVAPQLPVNPVSKSLAVIESKSSVPETLQNTDQPELFSVTEVSDSKSELSIQQEFKLDSRPNSELASGFESERIFKPEVEISNKPYTYPIKLRPQNGIVTVPDSAWKHVSLKPQPVVLPPLLPRPIPVREPAYGRLYFTQYPITSLTSNVPKVSPITKPTLAPFISKIPYNVWQTTHPESESNTQPELESTTLLEPEYITLPKSETTNQPTAQSKLNPHTSDTVSLSVMIRSKDEELIKEHTTVPPLRGDDISESSFTFEIPTNATNQTLITTKSQLIEISPIQTPIVTSQPAIMTTSPMLEATTTLPESDVLSNNQPQTVIVQLVMPPQSSLSVAPQLPVNPVSKSLAVIESKSSVPEAPQKTDQPELFSVSEMSDSKLELSTPQEFKLDSGPNSELGPDFESEKTFKPEVEISKKPYTYPITIRPQDGIVTVPDSAWKHVSLKPQPFVLPPLLRRPIPVREPVYGHYYNTMDPITLSTNYVPKVTPSIKTTPAPFIFAKPFAIRQPSYGRDTPSTTAIPLIEITQNTNEVSLNNVFASKRPKSFNLDFVCKEGNGYYTVENECDAYILCQKNKAIKFSCPDGLYFNPASKYNEYPCTYPSEVQCTNSTEKQNTIHTLTATRQCPKQYGLFSMNDGDCSKYIMCNIGKATIMNCPAGLVFNPTTESCDWVANVPQCSPQVFKDYTCPDPPVDEYGVATDIIYKYKYRNQCTQYIACQRGYPRLLSCERGLAFDEESQSCISFVYVQGCASYAV